MKETWFLTGKYSRLAGEYPDTRIESESFNWRLSAMQFVPWVGLKVQLADYGTVEVAKVYYRADTRPGKESGFVAECVPAPEGDQMLMNELKEHNRLPSGQREKMVLSLTAEKEKLTLSIAEVAEILRISRPLAYQAAHRGDLPGVVKFGKRIMVSRIALDRALREGWSPPSRQ